MGLLTTLSLRVNIIRTSEIIVAVCCKAVESAYQNSGERPSQISLKIKSELYRGLNSCVNSEV